MSIGSVMDEATWYQWTLAVIVYVLNGTRSEINLNSEARPRWFQCVQLPGSDLAAGAMKMMTALSQRRRNSHFSGDCEPAVAPWHPYGVNYGPWLQKIKK